MRISQSNRQAAHINNDISSGAEKANAQATLHENSNNNNNNNNKNNSVGLLDVV
jgi:hypothetical protein